MTDQALTSTPTRRTLFRGLGIAGAAALTGAAVPTVFMQKASAAPMEGFNYPISRQEVIDRAHYWVHNPRPYSMDHADIGPEEDPGILWRQDCSGFVSMALAARFTHNPTGLTTQTLHPNRAPDVSHPIAAEDLLPGDFILQLNEDSSTGVGHVVLFNGWSDNGYHCIEQAFSAGQTIAREATFPYDGLPHYHPFRYNLITD